MNYSELQCATLGIRLDKSMIIVHRISVQILVTVLFNNSFMRKFVINCGKLNIILFTGDIVHNDYNGESERKSELDKNIGSFDMSLV